MSTIFFTTLNHKLGKKIVILTLIIASIKHIDIKTLKELLKQPLIKILLATLLYMFISLAWTPDFYEGKGIIENYIFYFLLPIIAFSLIPNEKHIQLLIKVFIITMFVNEIISYGIIFELWGSLDNLGFPTPFMHHTAYSLFVTIAILIIGYEFIHENNLQVKFFYFIFLLTMSGNLIISGGRNGQATLLLTIIVFSILHFKTSLRKGLLLFLAPILLFTVAYFTFSQFKDRTDRIYSDSKAVIINQNFQTSFGNRLFAFFIADKYIEDYNYFLGEGAGSIKITKNKILEKHFKDVKHSNTIYTHFHQYYVSTLVQYGLVGLILLLFLFYYLFKIKIINSNINYIKNAIVMIMIFSNLGDGMLFIRTTMIVFAIFIGLILAQSRIEKNQLISLGNN